MHELPAELAAGLARLSSGHSEQQLGRATTGLIERYRADRPAATPIVATPVQARAYLLYRFPATYAAVRAVLDQVGDDLPAPSSQLDLAGGSGAACWAAVDRWPGIVSQTVIDSSAPMLAAGRELVRDASTRSLREIVWTEAALTPAAVSGQADLVTVSYLLSELDEQQQAAVIELAAAASRQLLVIVEPGTSAAYRRILTARERLLGQGWRLLAPCPHTAACPMGSTDWCHFPARVSRSAIHRRMKQADRAFEDEKFSYLIMSRDPAATPSARIVARPRLAKGRVGLTLCTEAGMIDSETVAKSAGPSYRAARDAAWGDPWP